MAPVKGATKRKRAVNNDAEDSPEDVVSNVENSVRLGALALI